MASDLATGHWQQALERFAPRRRSDAATVGITVACYAQSVLWAQGLQALVASAMAGTEVSGIAINAGIGSCVGHQRTFSWTSALALLAAASMQLPTAAEDANLHRAATRDAARGAYWEEVTRMMAKMSSQNIRVDASRYVTLSSALADCGLWMKSAWRRCLALWTEPLIAWDLIGCFGAMALGAAPQTWWYCLRVLERMPLLRVLPHLPAYRSAVRACGLGRAEVTLTLISAACAATSCLYPTAVEALGFRSKIRELVFAFFSACSILWFLAPSHLATRVSAPLRPRGLSCAARGQIHGW
eukprot:g3059.t1